MRKNIRTFLAIALSIAVLLTSGAFSTDVFASSDSETGGLIELQSVTGEDEAGMTVENAGSETGGSGETVSNIKTGGSGETVSNIETGGSGGNVSDIEISGSGGNAGDIGSDGSGGKDSNIENDGIEDNTGENAVVENDGNENDKDGDEGSQRGTEGSEDPQSGVTDQNSEGTNDEVSDTEKTDHDGQEETAADSGESSDPESSEKDKTGESSEKDIEDNTKDGTDEAILAPHSRMLSTENVVVKGIKSKYYTGDEIVQDIDVKYVGSNTETELSEGRDYSVDYVNNVNAGTAFAVVNGLGAYYGSLEYRFAVKPVSIKSVELKYSELNYTGTRRTQNNTMTVKAEVDGEERILNIDTDYTVSYTNNLNTGTASVYVTGLGNYKGTIKSTFDIKRASLTSVSLKYSSLTYNGRERTQDGGIVVMGKTGRTTSVLVPEKDYIVSYKNNVNIGTATVTVKGTGNFKGTLKKTFSIVPKGTTISSLIMGHRKIKAVWKNQSSNVSGYQVQYSTDPDFTSKKTFTAYKTSTVSRTFTGLTSGKTYYFRIRTFLNSDGKRYYSKWSKTAKRTLVLNKMTVSESSGKRTLKVVNPMKCNDMRIAVWTLEGGQDDLKWIDLTKNSSGTWETTFSTMKMSHSGTCVIHLYSGDEFLGQKLFDIEADENFLDIYLNGNDSRIDFIQCAVNIARDDNIGYGHTWPDTISCSGLVGLTLTYCGYGDFIRNDPLGWGYIGYGNTFDNVIVNEVGAKKINGIYNSSNYKLLKAGDILVYDNDFGCHVGIYMGNGYTVEARGPEGGSSADESGWEVAVYDWRTDPVQFEFVYRIPSSKLHFRW